MLDFTLPDLKATHRPDYTLTGDDMVMRYYVVVADVALLPVCSTNEHTRSKLVL